MIKELTKFNPWDTPLAQISAALAEEEVVELAEVDAWRLPYLVTLLRNRGEAYYRGDEDNVKMYTELIDSLVIN